MLKLTVLADADQDATDEASAKATEELIMFFYQPVTLSKLIDTVLNMTECKC